MQTFNFVNLLMKDSINKMDESLKLKTYNIKLDLPTEFNEY